MRSVVYSPYPCGKAVGSLETDHLGACAALPDEALRPGFSSPRAALSGGRSDLKPYNPDQKALNRVNDKKPYREPQKDPNDMRFNPYE